MIKKGAIFRCRQCFLPYCTATRDIKCGEKADAEMFKGRDIVIENDTRPVCECGWYLYYDLMNPDSGMWSDK